MSVINVTEMWSKKGGAISCKKADALDQTYSFTRGFQVLHTVGTDPSQILDANGLPLWGQQHPSGLTAFVTNKSHQAISPLLSIVVVAYDGEAADPETVDIEWTDTTTTEPIDRDYDGAAILTENLEPVDGLTMDVSDQIAVITRKFLTIDTYGIRQYRRATNSDTFLGWPPGTARLISFSAKNRFKYNAAQEQWDVTARIQFREPYANTTAAQAWYKRWRHEGLYVRDVPAGTIRRARDAQWQEMTKPVLLKEDGTEETDPELAVFRHTKVYGSLPYEGLGLL